MSAYYEKILELLQQIKDTQSEAIAAADEHGMAMVFTGVRHFRH